MRTSAWKIDGTRRRVHSVESWLFSGSIDVSAVNVECRSCRKYVDVAKLWRRAS